MMDLEKRPNPSSWARLMDLALPILGHVFPTLDPAGQPTWTLGGGTAIALRIVHRVSDDVDLFVGATDLRLFTPTRNGSAARLSADMQFPGNYLKFLMKEGEIDFLPGPLMTEPGFTLERFRGTTIALQTSEEVILKKVRYRATTFKPRDIFDLAAVARTSGTLGASLMLETGDRLPTLLTAIQRHDAQSFGKAQINPLPGFESLMNTALAEATDYVNDLIDPPKGKKRPLRMPQQDSTQPQSKEPSALTHTDGST